MTSPIPALPESPPGRPPLHARLVGLVGGLADFLLPPVCPACVRRLREEEYGLCGDCRAALAVPRDPLCRCCGRPDPAVLPDDRCENCRYLPRNGFDHARAAFLYTGPIVPVIHHFKYHRHEELSECLGRWTFLAWRERWADALDADCVVAVPLHPLRYLHRGFNQAECLADVIGRLSGLPVLGGVLQRRKRTQTQTRLSPKERWENVSDAFRVTDAERVAGARVLLIDDVMTTGATLAAAARALKHGGALKVHGLTVARALDT